MHTHASLKNLPVGFPPQLQLFLSVLLHQAAFVILRQKRYNRHKDRIK